MSDKQREDDGHNEPEAQEGSPEKQASTSPAIGDSPTAEAPGNRGPASPAKVPPARRGGGIAWLALLLALATAAGGGWWYWQNEQRVQVLQQRLQEVQAEASKPAPPPAAPKGLSPEAREAIDGLERAVETDLRELGQRLQQQVASLQPKLRDQSEQLQSVEQQLQEQRDALGEITGSDRDGWRLAEVQYLLRLANQRLLMTGDVDSARALLASADRVLRQVDDSSLHGVRRAVAADRAALRAVPQVDVEGLYLRLAALVDQIAGLVVFALPERTEAPAPEEDATWQDRLRQGYQQALAKLSDYIAIRRRESPVEALLDPQLEDLMRQNTAMLLQQSQIALLSGNQRLYEESLQRTRRWISEFFLLDERVAEAVLREIDDLAAQVVAVDLPDVDASLQALEAALDQRLLRQEEE